MTSHRMDGALEVLRQEYTDLAARTARFAITSLIVLAIGCLTLARAFRAINGEEVARTTSEIQALATKTYEPARLPWFLSSSSSSDVPVVTADPLGRKHELEEKLRKDVETWLTVDVSMVGANFRLNLQYWSFGIPVVLLGSILVLMIYTAKSEAIRRLAAAAIAADPSASPVDKLMFSPAGPTTFAAYPARFGTIAYQVTIVALLVNLFVAADSVSAIIGLAIDSVRWMIVFALYAVMTGRYFQRRILTAAAEIAPATASTRTPRFAKMRDRAFRVREAISRRWRPAAFTGSAMTILTLFMLTATSRTCSGGAKKGVDLLLGRNEAYWIIYEPTVSGIGPQIAGLGRFGYGLAIAAAVACLFYALVTIFPPLASAVGQRPRIGGIFRGLAVSAFFFSVCEFGFVFSISDFNPLVFRLIYWILPAVLYLATTVIGPKRWRRAWDGRLRRIVQVLYWPAIVFAPLGVLFFAADFPGIPFLVIGTALLATAMVLEPASVPVEEGAAAPAVAQEAVPS